LGFHLQEFDFYSIHAKLTGKTKADMGKHTSFFKELYLILLGQVDIVLVGEV